MIGFHDSRQTIVAIASAVSPAIRGSVRMSGEDCLTILRHCSQEAFDTPRRPKRLLLKLQVCELGELAVAAMIWPSSQSYTGAPTVEIHTIGSLPVLEAIVATLIKAGAKPAGPGEFTMRAFLAGRLDLTQAEAVLGVIDARSQAQLDAALSQLAGNLALPLKQARRELIDLLADIEAGLDFVDEDIQFISDEAILRQLSEAINVVEQAREKGVSRRRSEAFVRVVLRGEPNAGKSSLMNSLCSEHAAIVSDIAGTTRDTIWRDIRLGDVSIRLIDTAGIEPANDPLQIAGQQMAQHMAAHADLILHCSPAQHLVSSDLQAQSPTSGSDATFETKPSPLLQSPGPLNSGIHLRIATMSDQITHASAHELRTAGWMVTSAVSGDGLDELRAALESHASQLHSLDATCVPGTAARCADSMARALQSLKEAIHLLEQDAGHEYVADQIRQALGALGEVTGEIYTDDILDRVFSRFCIGK